MKTWVVVKRARYFAPEHIEDRAMPVYVRHLSREQRFDQALAIWLWQRRMVRGRSYFDTRLVEPDVWMWLFAAEGMPVIHTEREAFPPVRR